MIWEKRKAYKQRHGRQARQGRQVRGTSKTSKGSKARKATPVKHILKIITIEKQSPINAAKQGKQKVSAGECTTQESNSKDI